MKKLFVVALVIAMVFTLAACGGGSAPASNNEAPATEATDNGSEATAPEASGGSYTFGYIAYDMTDIWNEYSAKAFEYAATQVPENVEVVILDSKNSLEESVTAMESLIQQEVDGISIFPISPEQGAQLAKMANEAGIPVTFENFPMQIDDPGDYIAAVACNYDDIGYAAIKFIAENKPGAKIFFCAGQVGGGVYETYQEGVDRALAEYGDQVEIIATRHGDWQTEKAYDETIALINSGTEFDYIFANNGMMAKGCYQALTDKDMADIPIVSTGGSPDDYQMLVDGIESANMTAPVSIQGVQTFINVYNYVVKGQSPASKFQPLPIIPVSRDALDEFIAWDDYAAAYKYVESNY